MKHLIAKTKLCRILYCLIVLGFSYSHSTAQIISYPNAAENITAGLNQSNLFVQIGFTQACANAKVTVALPSSVSYVPNSLVQISSSGAPINIAESNISNLNAPIFSLSGISGPGDIVFSIARKAGCVSSTATNGKDTVKINSSCGVVIENAANINTYSLLVPSLSIMPSPGINNLLLGTVYNRSVTITNGGNGCVDTLYYYAVYPGGGIVLQSAPTNTISVGATNFTPVRTSGDTLFYKLFGNIFGADKILCNGESCVVSENIIVSTCTIANTITSYGVNWGRDRRSPCGAVNANVGVAINNGVPELKVTATYPTAQPYCRPQNYPINLAIKNFGTGPATSIDIWLGNNDGSLWHPQLATWLSQNWEFSIDGGITWQSTLNTGIVQTSSSSFASYMPATGAALALNAALPGLILQAGQTVLLRSEMSNCQFTDSTLCSPTVNYFNRLGYKVNYKNQCNVVLATGNTPIIGANSPINSSANAGFSLNETPLQLASGACGKFNFYITANGARRGVTQDGKRYAEVEWTLPTGLGFNNMVGDLTLVNQGNGVTISQLPGYPVVIGNRVITRWDYNSYSSTIIISLRLCNNCALISGGSVALPMVIRVVEGSDCVPRQWAAINCQKVNVNLLSCLPPVCTQGGINIDPANCKIQRSNFGLPDNNNDGIPDASGSIDMTKVFLHRYAEGDTMSVNLKSIVQTGTVGNFNNAGMDMTVNSAVWLSNGNATITVYDVSAGTSFSCALPVTLASNKIAFNFKSCLPASFVFENNDSIRIQFSLRVKSGNGASGTSSPIIDINTWGANVAVPTAAQKYSCSNMTYQHMLWALTGGLQVSSQNTFGGCGGQSYIGLDFATGTSPGFKGFDYEYRPSSRFDSATFIIDPSFTFSGIVRFKYNSSAWFTVGPSRYVVSGNTVTVNLSNGIWDANSATRLRTESSTVSIQVGVNALCSAPNTITTFGKVRAWVQNLWATPPATPYSVFSNGQGQLVTTGVNGTGIFPKPQLNINTAQSTITTYTGAATWNVVLDNTVPVTSNFTYFYIKNAASLTVTQVKDISTNTVIAPDVNGFYQLGTVGGSATKNYAITANLINCRLDSIQVFAGWSCGAYPTSNSGADFCAISRFLLAKPESGELQMSIMRQPGNGSNVSMCTSDSLIILVNSAQGGSLVNPYVNLYPPVGLTIGSSVFIEYPLGSGNYQSVPISSIGGGGYAINLLSHSAINVIGGLPGTIQNPGTLSRQAKIKIIYSLNCNTISGSTFRIDGFANLNCGNPALGSGVIVNSAGINIAGVNVVGSFAFNLSLSQNNVSCGTTKLNGSITPVLTPTSTDDMVNVNLPYGVEYAGNFVSNGDATFVSKVRGAAGSTDIQIKLNAGVLSGTTIPFSFDVTPNYDAKCVRFKIQAQALRNAPPIMCGPFICPNQSTAVVVNADIDLFVEKPKAVITNIVKISGRFLPGYATTVNVTITNFSSTATAAANSLLVEFFCGINTTPFDSQLYPNAIAPLGINSANMTLNIPPSPTCIGGDIIKTVIRPSSATCVCDSIGYSIAEVLPVTIVGFHARVENSRVKLDWQVANEVNLRAYELQWSADGRNFTLFSSILALQKTDYTAIHATPSIGANFYRMKMVDKNGAFSYSEIRKVDFVNASDVLTVYPNPAKTNVQVSFARNFVNKAARINIMSIDGRLVVTKNSHALNAVETVDVSQLSEGKYILQILIDTELITKSIEVLR